MNKIEVKRLRDCLPACRAGEIKQAVILFFIFHFLFSISAFAGSPGSSALNFLKIPAAVRAVGMGEAYVASAGGLDAVYYNPAGISQAGYQEFTAAHTEWLDGISYSFLGYLHPSESLGSFAGSLYYLSKNDIPGYDNTGLPTNKKWDVSDRMGILSYGRKLNGVSAGASIKFIQESLADESASAYCFDLGLLCNLSCDMNFGISASNVGGEVKYISETEEIPLIFRAGISYRIFPFGDDITLNLDYTYPSDNDGYVSAGGEYSFSDNFSLRAGFVGSKDMISKALRFGFGFGKRNIHFDYAFAPSEILENTHRFSLTLRFGRSFRRELVTGNALRCRAGEKYFRQGDLAKAIAEFSSVLKLEPENQRAKNGILKVKAELVDIKHGDEIRKHLRIGKKYYRDSKLEEALVEFEKVTGFFPEHRKANAYIARIDKELKQAELDAAIRVLLKEGKDAFQTGELAASEKKFLKVLEILPGNYEALDYIEKIQLKREIEEKKKERPPPPDTGVLGKITSIHFNEEENKTFISFAAPSEIPGKNIKVLMYGTEVIAEGEIIEYTDKTDKEFYYDAVLTKKNKEVHVGDAVSWDESPPVPVPPPVRRAEGALQGNGAGSRPSGAAEAEKTPAPGISGKITDRSFNEDENKTYISFTVPNEITAEQIKIMLGSQVIAVGEIIECTDKTDKEFHYDAVLTKEIKEVKEGSQVLILEGAKEEGYYFNKATQLFQQGKYEEAIAEWQKVLEINPEHQLSRDKIKMAEEKLQKKKTRKEKINIAVANLNPQAVSASEATFASEFLRTELFKSGVVNLIDRQNMEMVLAEQGFQQAGCTSAECAVQMGKILNVDKIVVGNFGKLMGKYVITISIVDVKNAKIEFSDKARCSDIDSLESITKELARSIILRLR
ncbi:MAG: PorV/PorQ family protein [bacterium]